MSSFHLNATTESVKRVLEKGKRELTDEEQRLIKGMLQKAMDLGRRVCKSVSDHIGADGALLSEELGKTFSILESSDIKPTELCIEAEDILRNVWAMLGSEAESRNIKNAPWVIQARTDLYKMAATIRYDLSKVGIHVPLYREAV